MNDDHNEIRIAKPKPRSKKLNPKIDLSSMVSVSFLLIIFFMVTVELAKPQIMHFGSGDRGCGSEFGCWKPDDRRLITLLLDDDNKIISYWGLLDVPIEKPKKLDYGRDGIRKELIRISKQIYQITGDRDRGAIVLIKPSKKSNYGNLVDILDEMNITAVGSYAIINDFTPEEYKLLASK